MRFWPLLLFVIFLIFPKQVFAEEKKFQVEHDVTFKVQEDLTTKVTQNIHITNLKTESLAKEFILKIKNPHITDFQAFDQSGSLPIEKYAVPGGVEVRIQFRKLASGEGKTLHWSLSYKAPGLVKQVGRQWKINLPKVPVTSKSDDVTVGLYVPSKIGSLLQARPRPTSKGTIWSGDSAQGQILTTFSKDTRSPYQAYAFDLDYYLENESLSSNTMVVALPLDTAYQKIFLTSLSEEPRNIDLDPDGNWLASFSVGPKATKHITAKGFAAVSDTPIFKKFAAPSDSTSLLKEDTFWPTSRPEIQKIASGLTTPESIYNFVTSSLAYNKTKLQKNFERGGALETLKNPLFSICTDFTDLFITLARAKGVKAREVNGYAYTNDQASFPLSLEKDILHAWPEFYDEKTKAWHMVDPTWGKTSDGLDYFNAFDFDHLALVIHGVDSEQPKAAGFYKTTAKLKKFISTKPESKAIHITPVDKDLDLTAHGLLVVTKLAPNLFSVKNTGQTMSLPEVLTLNGQAVELHALPPFGTKTIDLETNPFAKMLRWITNLFPNSQGSISSKMPLEK